MGHVPKNLIIVFRRAKHYMPVFYMTKPMWFITVEWPINARYIACKKRQVSVSSCLQGAMPVRSKSGFLDTQIIGCTNKVTFISPFLQYFCRKVLEILILSSPNHKNLCQLLIKVNESSCTVYQPPFPLFILVAPFKLLRVKDHISSSTDEYFQRCLTCKYFWVAIFKGLIVLKLSHVDQ